MVRSSRWLFASVALMGLDGEGRHPEIENPVASGRVTGKVTLSPAIASRKMRFRLYSDLGPGAIPRQSAGDSSEMANVVVYLESVPELRAAAKAASRVTISQSAETFLPRVQPVVVGSTVEFRNDDPIYHNVFSLSKAKDFDLGRFPQGQSRAVRFDKPGLVQVFCHIHADMSAFVMVLDHRFFAAPDGTGQYVIEGVPPGEYRIVAWHERARAIAKTIRIVAGETLAVDLSIPIPETASR